jgi:hypothetical protein
MLSLPVIVDTEVLREKLITGTEFQSIGMCCPSGLADTLRRCDGSCLSLMLSGCRLFKHCFLEL